MVLGVIPMVGFDVFFQIFSHLKKLRMSRQDIRDEFKQSEGDPPVKGRIRQMQRAAARRRMMADVPKADVSVNNPTHDSVALQYDENKMSAPQVVAKGAGLVAEFKQSEGDPPVKGRIRQMQRAAARRRMMADVPKADVSVNNPTHDSVALQYDENKMSAPQVVAKGAGLVALRIREIGAENNVPTLEAPPLARALYRHAEIGQQIPGQLYAAVAEVLAWVWQLKRWRLAGGQRPVQPTHLPVPEAPAVAEVLAWVWQLKRWRLAGGQRPVQPTHLPVPEALDFINEKPTHE